MSTRSQVICVINSNFINKENIPVINQLLSFTTDYRWIIIDNVKFELFHWDEVSFSIKDTEELSEYIKENNFENYFILKELSDNQTYEMEQIGQMHNEPFKVRLIRQLTFDDSQCGDQEETEGDE